MASEPPGLALLWAVQLCRLCLARARTQPEPVLGSWGCRDRSTANRMAQNQPLTASQLWRPEPGLQVSAWPRSPRRLSGGAFLAPPGSRGPLHWASLEFLVSVGL